MPKFRISGGDVEELGTNLDRLGLKGDACKQIRKEVGASLRCLDCMACFRDELDNVVEEEDGEWIYFLGGNNSSGTKKYRGSNSNDGGNTGDGVKITGGVIGSGGRIESSEELKEVLPDEAE
ncbi:hypothetical protein Tco_0458778, partial [Tanacetum coccineum]